MKDNSFLKKHHAFLITSNNEGDFLDEFLKTNLNFKISGNPDYWQKDIETFGVEDSRELKSVHFRKPFKEDGEKVFVIRTKFMTREAQNALLKILEDPQPNSFFFFILPSKNDLMSTLLSRFFILEKLDATNHNNPIKLDFEIPFFLKLSPAARIKTLAKIISSKNKNLALEFLNKLEERLKDQINWSSITEEEREIFELIVQSRSYLKIPSASIKMILENISLNLPKQ